MRWCYESPTIMSWHAQKHVLSRCIRLHRPPFLSSLLPHLSSTIFCWQPWGKKKLLHIHQTTAKQGALRKRRSSRLVPATGLHWFHLYIGLVFLCFLFIPLLFLNCPGKKKLNFCAKLTWKYLPVLSFLNRIYTSLHLFAPSALLMTKRLIFTRSLGMWPS